MIESSTGTVQVEAVVARAHRHGRHLTLPVIALFAIAGAAGFWVGALPEPWMNLTAGFSAAALAVLLGLLPVLSWLVGRVTLTSRRVIVRHGLFVQHRNEVPLARVREVRTRRGLVQRLFGSGTVELHSGPDAPLVLRDVPNVNLIVNALHELIEENYTRSLTHPFGADTAGLGAPLAAPHRGSENAGSMTPSMPPSDLTIALPRG